jgi:hypothetical protein
MNSDYVPDHEERKQILRSLIPLSAQPDDELEETALEWKGLTLAQLHEKVRTVYESMFSFEIREKKGRMPPGFSDEQRLEFMTELNGLCFGACPTCGYWGSYWKFGEDHWLVCERDEVKWNVSWANKEITMTNGSPTTTFWPWERISDFSQCLRGIEPIDITTYKEITQPVTPKDFQEMAELAVDLREIHHLERMLEWLRSETGLIGSGDAERQRQFVNYAQTSSSLLTGLISRLPGLKAKNREDAEREEG